MPWRLRLLSRKSFRQHGNAKDKETSKDQQQTPCHTQTVAGETSSGTPPRGCNETSAVAKDISCPPPLPEPTSTEQVPAANSTSVLQLPTAPATDPVENQPETYPDENDPGVNMPAQVWDRASDDAEGKDTEAMDASRYPLPSSTYSEPYGADDSFFYGVTFEDQYTDQELQEALWSQKFISGEDILDDYGTHWGLMEGSSFDPIPAADQPSIEEESVYPSRYPDCNKTVSREADLERHYKISHDTDDSRPKYPCDYKRCCRHTVPFFRLDHFRDHLRLSHKEDLLRSGVEPNKEWWASRSEWAVRGGWWRCSQCLIRVKRAKDGFVCPGCQNPCESERQSYRLELKPWR